MIVVVIVIVIVIVTVTVTVIVIVIVNVTCAKFVCPPILVVTMEKVCHDQRCRIETIAAA